MTSKPARVCAYPAGCSRLTYARFCDQHAAEHTATQRERERQRSAVKNSRRSSTVRRQVQARDGYTCQRCGRQSIDVQKHHIRPLAQGGIDAPFNIATLCADCHALVHRELRR
jgi:5-methylcytosine-specific restriction protein A